MGTLQKYAVDPLYHGTRGSRSPIVIYSVGNPRDQMTKYREFVTILTPHKVGFFRISPFKPNGIQHYSEI